jgi:hypothetical protein
MVPPFSQPKQQEPRQYEVHSLLKTDLKQKTRHYLAKIRRMNGLSSKIELINRDRECFK